MAAWLWACCVFGARLSSAQEACPGDVDGDGEVTADDVTAVLSILFVQDLDPVTFARADANFDGAVNVADVTAIISLLGVSCLPPTPTATPTPSATFLPTSTPTATNPPPSGTATLTPTPTSTSTVTPTFSPTDTPSPTPTPTQTCVVQPAQFGANSGELTVADCQREFGGQQSYTDVYTIAGTLGTAIQVNVAATSGIVPVAMVIDPGGELGDVVGVPPITFTVTTTLPYQIWVGSAAGGDAVGTYTLTVTALSCAPPIALSAGGSSGTLVFGSGNLGVTATTPTATPKPKTPTPTPTNPSTVLGNIDGTECPDPGAASVGTALNPVDLYTFTVSQVPVNLTITMQQVFAPDTIAPSFSIRGPDGYEILSVDDDADCTGTNLLLCSQARFLALQTGTYTIIASGGGGLGRYTLQLSAPTCHATALPTIPPDHPLTCPGQATPGPGCFGTLYGDPTRTTCAAPLPIPGISDAAPDPGSPANLYTFSANAGDVISVEMDPVADDLFHLYLLGPTSAGNPLLAQDDCGGAPGSIATAQLAATLPTAGTYTIVAASDSFLFPPDPTDPTDMGDVVGYNLLIQKCPVSGVLPIGGGIVRNGIFTTQDCLGSGGTPYRTLALSGTAGEFVNVSMASDDIDAFLRLFAPDGSVVENDDDPFDSSTTDARVNRILPADGTYFVEVSTSPNQGPLDLTTFSPAFTVQATSCPVKPAVPGAIGGTFQDTSCDITPGRKFDVYAFDSSAGPVPGVASIQPPMGNGCVVPMLAEGAQTAQGGCATGVTEIPVLSSGQYGFVVAGLDATTRGTYTAQLARCPLRDTVGYSDSRSASLTASSCPDATGVGADWYLVSAPAGLVNFNEGIEGTITADFPVGGLLTDMFSSTIVTGSFSVDDPTTMFQFGGSLVGGNLAVLLKVSGTPPATTGNYTLALCPAAFF